MNNLVIFSCTACYFKTTQLGTDYIKGIVSIFFDTKGMICKFVVIIRIGFAQFQTFPKGQ